MAYYKFNKYQYPLSGDWIYSKQINHDNDATNVFALVIRGQTMIPYINGEKQRTVGDIKLKDGKIALIASQESGNTTCKFEDTWVWVFDE